MKNEKKRESKEKKNKIPGTSNEHRPSNPLLNGHLINLKILECQMREKFSMFLHIGNDRFLSIENVLIYFILIRN